VSAKKMNDFPLVSIVIPVFNGSNYLAEAVDSALAQTYANIEVLVINDGSDDKEATRNIALSYGDRIRYFEKENGGVATALNFGIMEMKGEYFSWLSHDDKYLSNKIEKQTEFISTLKNRNVILYSDIEYIDEYSNFISNYKFQHYPPENFRPAFLIDRIISGCTLLIPRICFEKCGLFNTKLRMTQDYDLWFRISEKFDFIHQPVILIQSRLHKNQDTWKLIDISLEERDELNLHFIKNITNEEIIQFSKGNIAEYYLSFAIIMEASMCFKAKRYALTKAIDNLFSSNILGTFQNIFKLIILIIIILSRKLFICLFGFNSFVKFKKTIRIFRLKQLY
jgi:glycosyltransferase involved in cell wall biosynthesis